MIVKALKTGLALRLALVKSSRRPMMGQCPKRWPFGFLRRASNTCISVWDGRILLRKRYIDRQAHPPKESAQRRRPSAHGIVALVGVEGSDPESHIRT